VPAAVIMLLLLLGWGGSAMVHDLCGSGTAPRRHRCVTPGSRHWEALSVNSQFTLRLFKGMRSAAARPHTDLPEVLLQYQMMRELTACGEERG